MKKLLQKGVVGAAVYAHKLQIHEPDQNTPLPLHNLLQQYNVVFAEPNQLPPHREVDHTILLQPAIEIVNTRPYRLSHSQKDTMEIPILQLSKN
jgi:hypothetical protein